MRDRPTCWAVGLTRFNAPAATGVPAAVRAMVDMVASAGRAIQVGMSTAEVPLRIGSLTEKEIDVLGVSCADADDFAEAVAHIAHPAIRNRGTLGGSLAHADPASELPACMLALNATIVIRSPSGERRMAAEDFFTGIYETALSAQELLVAVELPVARKNSGYFFDEFARRRGDYAIVGLAAQAIVKDGIFADLRLAFFAVGDRPVLAGAANRLVNVAITPPALSEALTALAEELDPQEDQQASAAMRRHLAKVLMTRCVSALLGRTDLGTKGPAA